MKKSTKPRKLRLHRFDAARYLTDSVTIAAYLDEAFAANDPAEIAASLGTAARAAGMTKVARRTKLTRAQIRHALSRNGKPKLDLVIAVLHACGVKLEARVQKAPLRGGRV